MHHCLVQVRVQHATAQRQAWELLWICCLWSITKPNTPTVCDLKWDCAQYQHWIEIASSDNMRSRIVKMKLLIIFKWSLFRIRMETVHKSLIQLTDKFRLLLWPTSTKGLFMYVYPTNTCVATGTHTCTHTHTAYTPVMEVAYTIDNTHADREHVTWASKQRRFELSCSRYGLGGRHTTITTGQHSLLIHSPLRFLLFLVLRLWCKCRSATQPCWSPNASFLCLLQSLH